MKIRYVFLIAFINFILQGTWFQIIRPFDVLPNTSLILVVIFCALYDNQIGLIMAVFCGVLQDVFLSAMLGINLMIYLVIGFIIVRFRDFIFSDNMLTPFIFMIISTIIYNALWIGMMLLFGNVINMENAVMKLMIEMVENGIIGIIIYDMVLKKMRGYGLR